MRQDNYEGLKSLHYLDMAQGPSIELGSIQTPGVQIKVFHDVYWWGLTNVFKAMNNFVHFNKMA